LTSILQNELAATKVLLDGLANELAAAGGGDTFATVDGALAEAALTVDEIGVLNTLGGTQLGNQGGNNGTGNV